MIYYLLNIISVGFTKNDYSFVYASYKISLQVNTAIRHHKISTKRLTWDRKDVLIFQKCTSSLIKHTFSLKIWSQNRYCKSEVIFYNIQKWNLTYQCSVKLENRWRKTVWNFQADDGKHTYKYAKKSFKCILISHFKFIQVYSNLFKICTGIHFQPAVNIFIVFIHTGSL